MAKLNGGINRVNLTNLYTRVAHMCKYVWYTCVCGTRVYKVGRRLICTHIDHTQSPKG